MALDGVDGKEREVKDETEESKVVVVEEEEEFC